MTELERMAEHVRSKISITPKIGIVLGSGLGKLADSVEDAVHIPYSDIPGFPVSTAEGHKGEYLSGTIHGVPVILMNGRVHYYEGYTMQQVVTPVRVMALLGAQTVILTNASGGLNTSFSPGTIMCITDHITSFAPSPLIGPNDDTLGTRFPDMSCVYDASLRELLHASAQRQGIDLADGIYIQITGPAFETPTESRMYAMLGADSIGMSTACEAMALHHMGRKVLGISCITDMCIGNKGITTHEEIQRIADLAGDRIGALILDIIGRI